MLPENSVAVEDRNFCSYKFFGQFIENIAKHTKVDMIWVAGRSPTLVSHSFRGVAMNLKATTLTYLAIILFYHPY